MAELLGTKIENLIAFCMGIKDKKDGRELYEKHLSDIEAITPSDLFLVMHEQLKRGVTVPDMLLYVDKLINVFSKRLATYAWNKPQVDTFLYYLMQENSGLIERLEAFKTVVKTHDVAGTKAKAPELISELSAYNAHMQKLENVLFPYMEKKQERYLGLTVLWALHDVARGQLKQVFSLLQKIDGEEKEFNVALGRLYFLMYGLVEKQELILFPAASEVLSKDEFDAMYRQSFDYDFAYITPPKKPERSKNIETSAINPNELVTETGSLTMSQVEAMISALPLDMTLIDENDKVKFFSKPKDRIFPRSPAIIGRDVRNCHPPKSVHIVERILEAFKQGTKHNAKFWIQRDGLFVLIEYFALRDEAGKYMGTLEVSQEVSGIRALSGQQRLLDWDKTD